MAKRSGCGCGCLSACLFGFLFLFVIVLLSPKREDMQQDQHAAPHTGSAEIISSRLVAFKRPNSGAPMQMVMTKWRNTGTTPIRAINARFEFRDRRKRLVKSLEYTLYAAFNSDPGVAPGATYSTPKGEGFIFPDPTTRVDSVDVIILSVSDQGL